MKNRHFENHWVVITGASSGIGESFAKLLAAQGANLLLVARRKERLEALKEMLQQKHQVQVNFFAADISKLESCDELLDYATQNGRKIQMLINNAGRGNFGPFLHHTLEEHLQTIQLNITALTKLTYLFAAHMKEHGLDSHIANVASIASYVAVPRFGVYCGSKKYVRDLTETLNYEFKNSNIHFTCISPGGTWTEFMDNSGQRVKKAANASMMSADDVARLGLKGMVARKHSVVTGWINWLVCMMPKFVPSKMLLTLSHHSMALAVEQVEQKRPQA